MKLAQLSVIGTIFLVSMPTWAAVPLGAHRCETNGTCVKLTGAQRAELASGLKTYIKDQVDMNFLNGGITVGLGGEELATVVRGDAEVKASRTTAIDPDKTNFPYASISKTFVAMLIWKRIQAAAQASNPIITLTTPVSRFIPWQNHAGMTSDFWNSITIGGLLSHTSRVRDIDISDLWTQAHEQAWSAERMISAAQTLTPVGGPSYCNVCYSMLGKVLEDARLNGGTATTLAKILGKEIFSSTLNLTDIGVLLGTKLDDTFAFPQLGKFLDSEATLRPISLFFASGDDYGSLSALGRWAAVIFDKPDTWVPETFWKKASALIRETDDTFYYTYGGQREDLTNGATLVYKPAGFPFLPNERAHYAYAHVMAYVPEYGLTFGFLQNGSGYFPLLAARAILGEAMNRIDALRAQAP